MTERPAFLRTFAVLLLPVWLTAGAPAWGQKSAPRTPAPVAVEWTGLEAAVSRAKAQNKAVLLDVYTDWCGWCKKMDREVFANPAVAEVLGKHFALAKVNAESKESVTYKGQKTDGIGIARGFGVRGYPTVIFLNSDGELLSMLPGYVDADKFLPVVLFIGNREYEKMEWEAFLDAYTKAKTTTAR